ncbi:MAG: hypothetical protein CMJ39_12000 [Phycisphaerae bacterium]|nr:hypothetical protein [Phycisphaerae bacterium]|tara:strand:+ start:2858 stop:4321 length:1464 start_codon:yes stop_codon:yes gene_type:complete
MGIARAINIVLMTICLSGSAWAVPPVNPVPTDYGTYIWYVGNNTQYPYIQSALDACGDGDILVVTEGEYVMSIQMVATDVTLRPFCMPPLPGGIGHWADVVFINPTEGFENANGYAISMSDCANTYVGEPRQIVELPNGETWITEVQPGEYDPAPGALPQRPSTITRLQLTDPRLARQAMRFQSRSIDNVAVYSENGRGTFQSCAFSTAQGYGGGVSVVGDDSSIEFIKCDFEWSIATGNPLRFADGTLGPPVTVATIEGGSPKFIDCTFENNVAGGPTGVIYDVGSTTHWEDCRFINNFAPACPGNIVCIQSMPLFTRCRFEDLTSWKGTVFWESTGIAGPDYLGFYQCNFIRCQTADVIHGAVAWVECDDCEDQPPRILLSDCGFRQNQEMLAPPGGWTQFDVWTPYYPMFRIGNDLRLNGVVPGVDIDGDLLTGDLTGDGLVDTSDLQELMTNLGTCIHDSDFNGVVDVEDLLGFIQMYGGVCQ